MKCRIPQAKSLGSAGPQAEEERWPFVQENNITLRYLQKF